MLFMLLALFTADPRRLQGRADHIPLSLENHAISIQRRAGDDARLRGIIAILGKHLQGAVPSTNFS